MNINHVIFIMFFGFFLLVSCGQKGDLYIVDEVERKIVEVKKNNGENRPFPVENENLKRKKQDGSF